MRVQGAGGLKGPNKRRPIPPFTHSARRSGATPPTARMPPAFLPPPTPRQAGAGEASSAKSSEGRDKPSSIMLLVPLPPPPPLPPMETLPPDLSLLSWCSLKSPLVLGALPGLLPLPLPTLDSISRSWSSCIDRTPKRASVARASSIPRSITQGSSSLSRSTETKKTVKKSCAHLLLT